MASYIWGAERKDATAHAFKTGARLGMSWEEYVRSYKMRSVCGSGFAEFKKLVEGQKKRCRTCERHAK